MLKGMYNAYLLRRKLAEQGFTSPSAAHRLQQRLFPDKDGSPATCSQRQCQWEETSLQECYDLTQKAQAGEIFADSLLNVSKDSQTVVFAEAPDHSCTWLVDSLLLETRVARIH